jgi:uracil-DNA glycosylase
LSGRDGGAPTMAKGRRTMAMIATESCPTTGSAADFLPRKITLPALAKAAEKCQGCTLYCRATHVVFGEGSPTAKLVLIGEQPGDQEDLAGKPFVGPAGRVLDESLEAAKIDRSKVYVTNAVKHFKWEEGRGKKRLHSKPSWTEIVACRPWLIEELKLLTPQVIVCMGATAAQSLLGKKFRLTQHRGEFQSSEYAPNLLATVHPSSLLRIPDREARHEARAQFIKDFQLVARKLKR